MKTSKETQRNDRLRQARIERNWRQHELAEQLGTTTETIKRWERGYQQPGSFFRAKLCTLFGKSAEQLGLDEGKPPGSIIEKEVGESEPTSISPTEPGALWMVPYVRNPHFTGRDELLEQLAQELSSELPDDATSIRRAILSHPQAIKGLGGIGKTQIAVEYAYRARQQDRYTHTFWINAASEEAMLTCFQTLAEQLPNFAEKDEKDQRKLIASVKRWIEQCPQPWLLIVDNADDLSLAQPCLPQQGQGSILLTTRASAVGWLANPIEVEQMGLKEGTQFLLHRAQRPSASDEESNEATNIVIALDGFPLALDQAGAYIEETGCGFGDYLQLYERHRATLLARRGKQATHYPNSVVTTWSLSFEKIEQSNPAAADLLRLCAFLAPDHIPEELLKEGASHWPPMLQQAVTDLLTFNQMLEELLKFSLIKRLVAEHMLSIHRLVQVVQQERMAPDEQKCWAQCAVSGINAVFPSDPRNGIATWPLCQRYLEQVQVCDLLIQQYELRFSQAADVLYRAGIYLCEHALYAPAELLYRRALGIWQQLFGETHPQVAYPLNNLGELATLQGKYAEAESLYLRALDICEQHAGPEHPLVALVLNGLGALYKNQGRYREVEGLYQRALHIREQQLGPEHIMVGSVLHNLANFYRDQGEYVEAEALYLRTLRIWEQQLGPQHHQVANPLINLGILYMQQGKYAEAEVLLQRALHILEEQLGEMYPQVGYPLLNLGELYAWQGKYAEAEPFYLRALHIWEQAPVLLAHPLNGLANLSREQGHYEQADTLYQRVLSLRQEHQGPQHPEVAETLHDLARLREGQQRLTEALSLYQQALSIWEQALGSHHPKTTQTRQRLCTLLRVLGRAEEAAVLEALPDQARQEDESDDIS